MEVAKKIGWMGTGVMGKSMCKHLLNAGYDLTVYNRTISKTEELVSLGAKVSDIKSIGESCDVIFFMLGYPKDVQEIVDILIPVMKECSLLIDHTTSSPDLAKLIHKQASERNIHVWDAPVTGGDIGAREGRLVVMFGGEEENFDVVKEIMQKYSCKIN
jgi:3-hydroxyisobutyrate dehydrogenase